MRPAASSISGSWTAWRPDAKAGPRVLQLSLKKEVSLRNQCAWRRFRRVLFCLLRRSFGVDGGGPTKRFVRCSRENGLQHPPRRGTARRAALCRAERSADNHLAAIGKAAADKAASHQRITRTSVQSGFLLCSAACGECAAAVAEKTGRCRRTARAAGCAAVGCWRGRSLPPQLTHLLHEKSPVRHLPRRAFCAAYSARSWPGQRSPHKGAGALPQALKNGITRTAWPASAGTRNDPLPCRRPRRTALQHARGKPASGGCNGSRW